VNPDPRESDLALIPAETLQLWRSTGPAPEAAAAQAGTPQNRRGLWQWVLLVALGLAAAESFVANRRLAGESEGV